MKTWELANEFVDKLLEKCEKDEPAYKYPTCVGALQAHLESIFIELSVYHPEAFQTVLKKLKIQESN